MFSFVGIEAHSAINKKINANIKTFSVCYPYIFSHLLSTKQKAKKRLPKMRYGIQDSLIILIIQSIGNL